MMIFLTHRKNTVYSDNVTVKRDAHIMLNRKNFILYTTKYIHKSRGRLKMEKYHAHLRFYNNFLGSIFFSSLQQAWLLHLEKNVKDL